jgi:hypothetical protein
MEVEQLMVCQLAEIRANNRKFEVLQGTLVSRMDAHHAKTEGNHEELKGAMKASHERVEARMHVSLEKIGMPV